MSHLQNVEHLVNVQKQTCEDELIIRIFSNSLDHKNISNLDLVTYKVIERQPGGFLREAIESVMCDVIKIRLKRRDATRCKIK